MGRLIDVERVLEPYKILRDTDTLCVATIRQNILECPTVEAIPKADYENRLKADLVAMLEDLKQDIIAESWHIECYDVNANDLVVQISDVDMVIQQKIDKLKEK